MVGLGFRDIEGQVKTNSSHDVLLAENPVIQVDVFMSEGSVGGVPHTNAQSFYPPIPSASRTQ